MPRSLKIPNAFEKIWRTAGSETRCAHDSGVVTIFY